MGKKHDAHNSLVYPVIRTLRDCCHFVCHKCPKCLTYLVLGMYSTYVAFCRPGKSLAPWEKSRGPGCSQQLLCTMKPHFPGSCRFAVEHSKRHGANACLPIPWEDGDARYRMRCFWERLCKAFVIHRWGLHTQHGRTVRRVRVQNGGSCVEMTSSHRDWHDMRRGSTLTWENMLM